MSIKKYNDFLNEGNNLPGDEALIIGVLKGLRPGATDTLKPDLSNLEPHMKRWRINFMRATYDEVMKAVNAFVENPEDLSTDFLAPPGEIDPDEGDGRWTEEKVKKWVEDKKREGYRFYGSYSRYGRPGIVLSKKKVALNTLDMSKPLEADDFWNDFYANYV